MQGPADKKHRQDELRLTGSGRDAEPIIGLQKTILSFIFILIFILISPEPSSFLLQSF